MKIQLKEIEQFSDLLLFEKRQAENETIKFRAPFLQVDSPTKNDRVYPKEIMKKEFARLKARLEKNESIFGGPRHPVDGDLETPDVSHIINDIGLDERTGICWCEGEILPTSKGRDLAVVLNNARLGLSIRGYGTVAEKDGHKYAQEDFELHGIDFTLSPASDVAHISKANIFESYSGHDDEQKKTEEKEKAWYREAVSAGYRKDFETYKTEILERV